MSFQVESVGQGKALYAPGLGEVLLSNRLFETSLHIGYVFLC